MRSSSCSSLVGLTTLLIALNGTVQAQLTDVTQPGDPIVPSSNNSPGSEGVANAIDNQPTKYLNFDKLNTGFTVSPRVGLTVVQCLTLTSANDAPERDPASYTLEGSYDGTNFTLIAQGPVPAFSARFQKVVIAFDNNTPYLIYRLIFPTVANEAAANSMQISEVELLGFLAPTDVTQPGDPIVPSSNNTPGSEGVANAIDNQPTKYLNFDRLNTGFTVTPSVGPTLVSGLTLTSANDAPERDPASYTLEGSLDGTSFFPISSGPVPPFPNRFYKNYIFFSNARAYRAYRLIFPTVVGPGGNSMQISEVELLGDVADIAQDITLPGDPIVPTSNNSPGSEGAANAIDNQPTKYLNFDKLNTGFTVDPGARGLTVVSGLALTSANDAPERDPASYVLSGSYDGVAFTDISSGPVAPFAARFEKQTILFNNNLPYLQYRLIFPTVANAAAANSMQIAEVELLGLLADTDVTTPGDPIVASSNNSPGSEGAANAIDNQPTKYLNFDKLNTGFTVTPRVGGTILVGLSLTSANDAPERDPASYVLTGSEDGQNFVPISSGAVPVFAARFQKQYIFFPNNTKEFAAYRLIFPTVANESAANSMQISEVEFLGHQRGGGSCTIETNGVLITRQPQDTPVLLGSTATFRVRLSGPWKVQWYRGGNPIPGANNATYTTPAATAADDGAQFFAKVGPATVGGVRGLCETSDTVMLNIFTPSPTECIGLSWRGAGANGAPTDMLPTDITGFEPQAYWNNLTGGSGSLPQPLNSSNVANPTITVTWATSGEWGVGTGNSDPLERMLNGMVTSYSTDEGAAQTVTLSGVPAGHHSLFLYTVQVPQEFFNMDFAVVTHDAGGNSVVQRRYIRPLNSDEYNPSPGFSLVTAQTAADRGVGNMMRFDNLQPGPDGIIDVRFFSPGRVDLPGGDPVRGPGLDGLQLCLNPPPAGDPPVITRQPASANGIAGGCITLAVEAVGPNLAYQWLKNGQAIRGETAPQFTLANLQASDAGTYSVAVSNPAGRVLSRNAVVGVVASAQITLGLIDHFNFEDLGGADGFTAENSVAGGQNGVIQGTFVDFPPGQVGSAPLLNGVDNYVFIPDYPKVSGAVTVAGWVNSFSDQWGPLVNNWVEGRTTGSSGQFFVDVMLNNGIPTLRAQIEVGPNRVQAVGPIDGTLGVWHHFAMSANGRTLSIYWDGQMISTEDYLGSINATPSLPWLAIGANLTGDSPPMLILPPLSAQVDDIGLWNRSLSAAEIQGIYSAGLSGLDISMTPPVLTVGSCPPIINCSSNPVVECAGGLTPVTYTVTAVDASGAPVPVTCVPPSGSGFRLGQSNVVCTATDSQNLSASCTFRVTVVDPTPPGVTCNTNITADATGPNGAVVTYIAGASDPCGLASLDCSPPSGSTFPVGTTTVLCLAVDVAGNSNACSFTVTVRANQPPVLNCSNLVAECTGGLTPVTFTVNAIDPEDGAVPVTCTPPSGTGFRLGTSNVTCTATDSHGLSSSCTFTVTVVDTTPPVVSCPADITAPATSAAGAVGTYVASAADPGGLASFACTPPSASTFAMGTTPVTCTAVDAAGLTASCTFTVTVASANEPPVCDTQFPCTWTEGGTFYAIALDGAQACVVLDGSGSTDPDVGDTLSFTWIIDGTNHVSGVVVTNCLATGCHSIGLVVSDGLAESRCQRTLCVLTAGEAVEQTIALVESTSVTRKNKRPLIASLKAAGASFDRGSLESGLNQLHAFQNKVRAQIAKDNPAEAAAFIKSVQNIIDAVNCASQ